MGNYCIFVIVVVVVAIVCLSLRVDKNSAFFERKNESEQVSHAI